jgi:hypothetical protein
MRNLDTPDQLYCGPVPRRYGISLRYYALLHGAIKRLTRRRRRQTAVD